jgi:hypothetical protein
MTVRAASRYGVTSGEAMKFLLLTLVLGIPQRVIVERGNFVLGVFTDGWICYGQREPKQVDCHRAISSPVERIVIK